MGQHRTTVADFWDDVLERWTTGRDHQIGPLRRWADSYRGSGKGAVDLSHYPDPYVGDLRGETHEPRMVVLGLNPGIGYDRLQGQNGTWTARIRECGYSRCFLRSPAEDPDSWLALHGRPSAYWNALLGFAARWLEDDQIGVADILGFELYPWHSAAVTAPLQPPADLIDAYVWMPISEIDVSVVFALGAPWFRVVEALGLPRTALFGKGGEPFAGEVNERANWRVGIYELPSGQHVVVNAQSGSGQPPGSERTEIMRATLAPVLGDRPRRSTSISATERSADVECDRCGRSASHLVAGGGDTNAPGRLLVYCRSCCREVPLELVLPFEVVAQDPGPIMTALYRSGVTTTDPDHVAEKLPLAGRVWLSSARRAVGADRPGLPESP